MKNKANDNAFQNCVPSQQSPGANGSPRAAALGSQSISGASSDFLSIALPHILVTNLRSESRGNRPS
jgi:hypothetical protein